MGFYRVVRRYMGVDKTNPPDIIEAERAPLTTDTNFDIGDIWINKLTDLSWQLTSVVANSANWTLLGPGASDVDTLTGNAGGAVAPVAGNIDVLGGTNITSTGTPGAITFDLDDAISLVTSVTSPLYLAPAATDLTIEATTGQDIIIQMGDAAAANKVSFTDSGGVEVASIDSDGAFTTTGLTFTGLLTALASATIDTAGTALNLATDNDAADVNLGLGTTARDIHIGDSAAAHTITIGSLTGAASLDLQFGTGNFTLDGPTAGTILIGDSLTTGTITIGGTAQTGAFDLAPSTAALTATFANANGAKVINIGNGISGNTISLGNGINTSAQVVNIANGASAANSTVNILSGIGTAGAGVLALGNNTRVTTIGIANIAPAAARTVTLNGGDSAQNDTLNVMSGNPSAGAQTVSIFAGVPTGGTQVLNLLTQTGQAGTINIATGAAMANTVNIGGTGANVIGLGNTQTGGSVSIGDAMTTGTISIGGSGAQTGTLTIAGGTGAQTVAIADSTGGKTVDIATGAGANTVTIGSTNTTSSTVIQAGTGGITFNGTVNELDAKFAASTGDEITFQQSPILQSNLNTGAAPTGATGDVNLMMLQSGVIMEQFILGAGQTIIAPRMTASGLLVSGDLVATEGFEYNFGAARTNSRHAFTIGTSAAFFMEMSFTVADVSGAEPIFMGFRIAAANNATLTAYTDYALIGLNDAVNTGTVIISTELNGGGTTNTNTTDAWVDGATHTLRVNVSATGVVTYLIDGVAPTVTAAFTFDNGDVVCPIFRLTHGAAVPGAINWNTLKIGFQ